jgi:hypothetical protein
MRRMLLSNEPDPSSKRRKPRATSFNREDLVPLAVTFALVVAAMVLGLLGAYAPAPTRW